MNGAQTVRFADRAGREWCWADLPADSGTACDRPAQTPAGLCLRCHMRIFGKAPQ